MPSDALPDDLEMLKAMLLAERMRNERLRQIIKELQRHRFGRRAETLPEDQMLLGLQDLEQTAASDEAIADHSAPASRAARAEKRRTNRGSLPAHLPRIEFVVDIDDKAVPAARANSTGWRRQERAAGHCAGAVQGARHRQAEICLPALRGRCRAGPCQRA
jgi:transposase